VSPAAGDIVLLHGFGSTGAIFDPLAQALSDRYAVHCPDLPGHGRAANELARSDDRPAFAEVVDRLLARLPERFELLGYSLGGRIALHLALAGGQRIGRLYLVSTTAGIEDPAERQARRLSDLAWAKALEREPYDRFISRWRAQPVFAGEPPQAAERSIAAQRECDPAALAVVMRRLGTGAMKPLWSRLAEITIPTVVIVGSRDNRYRRIGKRLAEGVADGRLVVVEGGHNLVAEAPDRLAAAILAS